MQTKMANCPCPSPFYTLMACDSGPNAMLPTTGTACSVAVGVSDSVSAPLSASVNASVSVSDVAISSPRCPCSGRDVAVRNVSTELAREPGRTPPRGVEGIRNEDGATGFRVVGAAGLKDGKAGR